MEILIKLMKNQICFGLIKVVCIVKNKQLAIIVFLH